MMLRIKDFHSGNEGIIFYEGKNHYYIGELGQNYFLVVEKINSDTDEIEKERYTCSALSTALETIELMENREED